MRRKGVDVPHPSTIFLLVKEEGLHYERWLGFFEGASGQDKGRDSACGCCIDEQRDAGVGEAERVNQAHIVVVFAV